MSEELGLVEAILILLSGNGREIDEEDRKCLPSSVLAAMTPEKEVEADGQCRRHLLDILRIFLWKLEGTRYLKSIGTYFVLRELHKWECDDEILEFIEEHLISRFFVGDDSETVAPVSTEAPKEASRIQIDVLDDTVDESISKTASDGDSDAEYERELAEYDEMMAKKEKR